MPAIPEKRPLVGNTPSAWLRFSRRWRPRVAVPLTPRRIRWACDLTVVIAHGAYLSFP